jgi:hypothetical protein
MITLNEAPQINVHLVKSGEAPGGIGEPGTSCVMPTLTNAIYAASGRRISQAARRRTGAGGVGTLVSNRATWLIYWR